MGERKMVKLEGGPFDGREVDEEDCLLKVRRGEDILFAVYKGGCFLHYQDQFETDFPNDEEDPEESKKKEEDPLPSLDGEVAEANEKAMNEIQDIAEEVVKEIEPEKE